MKQHLKIYILQHFRKSRNLEIVDLSFVERFDPVSIPEDVFHPTFKLSSNMDKIQNSHSNSHKSSKKVFDFNRTDYLKLNQRLSSINWESAI